MTRWMSEHKRKVRTLSSFMIISVILLVFCLASLISSLSYAFKGEVLAGTQLLIFAIISGGLGVGGVFLTLRKL